MTGLQALGLGTCYVGGFIAVVTIMWTLIDTEGWKK